MKAIRLPLALAGLVAATMLALLLAVPGGGAQTALAAGTVDCTPVAPVPIPDNGKGNAECTVTKTGTIKDLNVSINVKHSFKQDLEIQVTHVDTGTQVVLIDNKCGSNNDIVATLDDEGAALGCPISGTVQPQNPLSAFDGESIAGTWRLTALDQQAQDSGSINGWSLEATVNPVEEASTQFFNVTAKKLSGPADRVDITFASPPGTPKVDDVFAISASILKAEICVGEGTLTAANNSETWSIVFTDLTNGPTKCIIGGEEILVGATPFINSNQLAITGATFYNTQGTTDPADDVAVGPGNAKRIDWGKLPRFDNIWLCGEDARAEFLLNCNGTLIATGIGQAIKSPDPKCVGFPNFQDPATCPRQELGAFEFEVRFNAKYINVDLVPLPFDSDDQECATIEGEGFVQLRCNTKGKENPIDAPNVLAFLVVTPTPDVFSLLRANQENGIVTQLINQDCQLADLQGHPIPLEGLDVCQNGAVTLRYLEGDVHSDCEINVQDQQQIAFRWGSRLGQLLYNENYDLEPAAPKLGDNDIDAKDLQVVYGRHGSTCHDPHPDQPPVDPKSKVNEPSPE